MATALRPIHHEDRLSLVEHLDELRTRIIICIAVFLAAFAVCFWQNDRILDALDRPLEKSAFTKNSEDPLERAALFQQSLKQLSLQLAIVSREMARSNDARRSSRAFPGRRQRPRPRRRRRRRADRSRSASASRSP
jgi:sec-independent protein translocase protein TatC